MTDAAVIDPILEVFSRQLDLIEMVSYCPDGEPPWIEITAKTERVEGHVLAAFAKTAAMKAPEIREWYVGVNGRRRLDVERLINPSRGDENKENPMLKEAPDRLKRGIAPFLPAGLVQGGAHRFVREGGVTLTAEQAETLVQHCVHPVQTKVRKHHNEVARDHISVLAEMMRRGLWTPKSQIVFARLENTLWIVDGAHRMYAQSEYGGPILWSIAIHDVASESEFLELFHRFNTNTRGRTNQQIVAAARLGEEEGVPRQVASAIYGAMPIIASGFGTRKDYDTFKTRIHDLRLQMAQAFIEQSALFAKCIKPADYKLKPKLLNAGITAVALITLKYQEEIAITFWNGVARDDGLKKGDPRHTFVRDLRDRALNSGSATQIWAVAAVAWNAFKRGDTLKIIKVATDYKIKIDGTPYDGSR